MFKKPFKIKFQIQLKNTERKKFSNDLKILFPLLSDGDISTLVNNKDSITRMKVTTFKDEDVDIYCLNKIPIFVEMMDSEIKFPTVFLLWKFPHMLPNFTSTTTVLNKLKSGADLFFPGIYLEGILLQEVNFKVKEPVYVNLIDNKAAVAVGLSLVNKSDIVNNDKHEQIGKLLKVHHTVGDFLFKTQTDPNILQLGPPDWIGLPTSGSLSNENDFGKIEEAIDINVANPVEELSDLEISKMETNKKNTEVEDSGQEKDLVDSEDSLLEYCFFKALKTIPKNSYPILPATFYAKHILTSLPEGKNLNLKKTKWKKFSTFLQEKCDEGLIQLQSLAKSDFTIASANTSHQRVKEFVDPYNVISVVASSKGDKKPVVQQVYSVTATTLPFFSKFGLKKHDELTRNDVRNYLNDFIRSENLSHPSKPEFVVLDPILCQILKDEEVVSRANLLMKLLEKMGVQHKVFNCGNGDAILHKGKMPLVEFDIALRTGNKKVTLISNLECYGVNVSNFSKELQHKAAASTTLVPFVPGKKGPQLQVQGNQIAVACAILKEKYNLNEKFMKNLDKAVKPKGKK